MTAVPDFVEPESPPIPDAATLRALHTALSHPTRTGILRQLQYAADTKDDLPATVPGAMSPKELSDVLDAPLGNVSYHVRTLTSHKLIKLVKKIPRRGALEHFYELSAAGERTLTMIAKLAGGAGGHS